MDFKKILPHIAAIIIFLTLSTVYFLPQTQGKVLSQTDIMQVRSMASEIYQYRKQGDNILWTNSQFSGMPTYQISFDQKTNVSKYIEKASQLFMPRPIGYFLGGMIVFYLALIFMGVSPWLSIVGAIAFAFTTNNLVLYEAGHTSKVRVLMMCILIVVGMIKVFKKDYLLGGLVFAVGMAVSVFANHPQMVYYLGMVMAIYAVIATVDIIKKKDFGHLAKSAGILAAGIILAVAASASSIWTTLEYASSTMRGKPVLEKQSTAVATSSSETDGLEWNYSMNWSNGMIDLVAMYIPGVAGGGSSEPVGKLSATNKYMKKNRMRPIDKGPLYWGKLPFTSGPQYIGAISFLMFFLGLIFLPGRLRWWALAALVLTAMLSLGKNLEWFNRLLFDNLPLLNKFRSPSSVTSITAVIVPFIGILGLHTIFTKFKDAEKREQILKPLFIVTGALSALCLFYISIGPSIIDFQTAGDARYQQQAGLADAFAADRAALMRSDAIRTLLLTLIGAGLIFAWAKSKLSQVALISIMGVLVIFDLWSVDKRYLDYDSFQKSRVVKATMEERPVDKQIKQDSDIHYRVHDLTPAGGPFNSSAASYHHKTIGGYHAAKLQRYDDIKEAYLQQGNQSVLDMLNTKYFIIGQAGAEEVRKNPGALGNAWFVNDIQSANTNREEFEKIANINPRNTAIVHESFSDKVQGLVGNGGSIKLVDYHPDRLVYQASSNGANLSVFSEVWYGPNKGWKAYIDGEEAPIIRVNYILRGVVIPEGSHEVVLEFKPRSYTTGKMIGTLASILLISAIAFGFWQYFKSSQVENEA